MLTVLCVYKHTVYLAFPDKIISVMIVSIDRIVTGDKEVRVQLARIHE